MSQAIPVCPRCTAPLPAGARFCPGCGARIAGAPRPLRRDRTHAKLAGVCAGLGEYFDVDPNLARAVYAVATFFSGVIPGLVLYVILALVIPAE
ncbi:MAG: PspC domain-containing protein [Acidobacteriota bacterium]